MTTTTTTATFDGPRPSLLSRIGAFFADITEAHSRSDQVMKLQALSDDELAARGLTRDEIVRHVFADKLYL
ncbi:MAG: DUF1127 domain-containing protein [Maritimibacter sp.]|nr:DUF1127 domain-containing protein [Maritimibacter sp.]